MALIITNEQTPVKTVADVVNGIKRINTAMYKAMKDYHTMGYNQVWLNPDFTPEQIIAEFGQESIGLFQLSGGIQQILKNANPAYEMLDPNVNYDITPNADGTVSVVRKPNPPVPDDV